MPRYAHGQRVVFTNAPQQKGVISYVHPLMGGLQFYDVQMDVGGMQTTEEHDLGESILAQSAWDLLAANLAGSYQDFGIATTLHKIKNATNNTISSLRASRTLFKPYQYKPLIKLLQSDSKRILVADEVGLGKTIEAGHIMLELRGRRMLRNALIVCPKSLQENWQIELREKFSFEFKLYKSTHDLLGDLQRDLNTQRSTFAIVTYERCRNRRLLDFLSQSGYLFDLLICDESHRLRNSTPQLYGAFRQVVQHAESVIFLTATPIMLSEEDLFNQIRLLEPETYQNYQVFQNAINLNRPFIRALHHISRGADLKEILAELEAAEVRTSITIGEEYRFDEAETVSTVFGRDPLYQRARSSMQTGPNTPANRARIQSDLSELNSLNHLYTRTRKRDVTTDRLIVKRRAHHNRITLSETEQQLYEAVAKRYDNLGVITHKRMVTSSIVAYYTPADELKEGQYRHDIPDSKFDAFERILEEVVGRSGKKLLVFSTFKKTLRYLELKLRERGIESLVLHGEIDDRMERVERFKNDPSIRVLLLSEVGREGLNLQFCDALVNYDLPWNPMLVEQRIGRIDRIGQQSESINIYSFTLQDTIEERIYERLLQRINIFRNTLGDLEDILSEEDHTISKKIDELERTLYMTRLTTDEQNELIDHVAQAIETERLHLQRIEENLTDAIVSDVHFQNEIDRIVRSRRYLTEDELRQFVESLFRIEIQTHRLEAMEDSIYRIDVPNNDRRAMFDFIEQWKDPLDVNPELGVLYHHFKRKYYDERTIQVTFNQERAYASGDSVAFLNSYHPLINAAANFLESRKFHANQAYRLALSHENLGGEVQLEPGDFLLTVFKIKLEKVSPSGMKSQSTLHAILADLNGESPVLLDEETSALIFGLVQRYATSPRHIPTFDGDLVRSLRTPVAAAIMNRQHEMENDEQVRLDSSALRRRLQHQQFYDNQIRRRHELLASDRGIRRILESDIEQLKHDMQRALESIDSVNVRSTNEIVSVSYLEILK